jgi:dTDP-glucose 4,6-dehydratase
MIAAMKQGLATTRLHDFLAADFPRFNRRVLDGCTEIEGKRLYLSGATGFFGKNLLAFFSYLRGQGVSFEVTALSREPELFLAKESWCREQTWLKWLAGDAREQWPGEGHYDLLLHAATDTAASAHTNKLNMFEGIVAGTRRALEFASNRCVRRILLCGSGAQYGAIAPLDSNGIPETDNAACDSTKSTSAYGEAKRASETLGALYAERHQLKVINTRCFAFVGPGLPLDGHFVVGNCLRAALAQQPIQLLSAGEALRSYMYGADLAVWLVFLLLKAPAGATVNVGSDKAITVLDLARQVASIGGSDICVKTGNGPIDEERRFYVPGISYARSLGLDVWTDLDRAITRTANWHRLGLAAEKSGARPESGISS